MDPGGPDGESKREVANPAGISHRKWAIQGSQVYGFNYSWHHDVVGYRKPSYVYIYVYLLQWLGSSSWQTKTRSAKKKRLFTALNRRSLDSGTPLSPPKSVATYSATPAGVFSLNQFFMHTMCNGVNPKEKNKAVFIARISLDTSQSWMGGRKVGCSLSSGHWWFQTHWLIFVMIIIPGLVKKISVYIYTYAYVHMYIYIYVCVCVCVCV